MGASDESASLQVGGQAPDMECILCDGKQIRLSDLWAKQKLLLAFTRHLGCTFCREQLLSLKDHYQSLRAAGIEVLAVTMRSPESTLPLQRKLELPFPCACDPQLALYRAYQTRKGSYWRILGPSIWGRAIRSLTRHGMGVPAGDITQLHAHVLMDVGGKVLFTHYPETSAEQISCPAILEAAQGPQGDAAS